MSENIAMNDESVEIPWAKIAQANPNLSDRLFREGVSLVYDEDGDTLIIIIGEGGVSLTKQAINDVYIRIEPETLKIAGCVILGFVSDFYAKNKIVRKLLPPDTPNSLREQGTVRLLGHDAEQVKPTFETAMATR